MTRPTPALAGLAATAVLLLAGCSTVAPGVAASVGDEEVSVEQVDAFASALCSLSVGAAAGNPDGAQVATRSARSNAVGILIDVALANQFADRVGYELDGQTLASALVSAEGQAAPLDEADRAAFLEAFRAFTRGNEAVAAVGRRSLAAQGVESPDPPEISQEGLRLLGEYAAGVDIEVDPRFGSYQDGRLLAGSGSLSVPVSQDAQAAAAAELPEELLARLPPAQKCS